MCGDVVSVHCIIINIVTKMRNMDYKLYCMRCRVEAGVAGYEGTVVRLFGECHVPMRGGLVVKVGGTRITVDAGCEE